MMRQRSEHSEHRLVNGLLAQKVARPTVRQSGVDYARKVLASQWAGGIRVNAVAPSVVMTELVAGIDQGLVANKPTSAMPHGTLGELNEN
jgi:hypothetical protein